LLYARAKVYQKSLSEFIDLDAKKEGFDTLESFKEYWLKNIGEWNPSISVWVHEFELINKL
jgi:hypothetical protein